MRVAIVTRQCDVPDVVQTRAREQMEKLSRFDPRLSAVELIFQLERHIHKVEAIASAHGEQTVVAHAHGDDFRLAVDEVTEKLSRILRRRRKQATDHQALPLSQALPKQEEPEDEEF